ncbi:glutaredoxin 3 [Pseudooceanicola sp. HF7]|uniref:glutaredoxin 3 n=1 Tax=Pseudooceanicola sp. HF7 TaxID=2721560 RepID=UPI00142F8F89|nr:glutaredoxin 3 [Pseudooceanicola sp. HF7]NIZ09662.1 glutaredoxin 3 [Pseudooceanicola sp. HF7]
MQPIDIYTTRTCGFCQAAKRLLDKKGVAYNEIDVSGDAEGRAKMTQRAKGRTSVPQIFVGETHVGGCDELYELDGSGKLDPLLAAE